MHFFYIYILPFFSLILIVNLNNSLNQRDREMVAPARPQFVLFGSSIVQLSFSHGGWGSHLSDIYSRKVLLINSSLSHSVIAFNTKIVFSPITLMSVFYHCCWWWWPKQLQYHIIWYHASSHVMSCDAISSTPLFSFFHFSHGGFHSLAHL